MILLILFLKLPGWVKAPPSYHYVGVAEHSRLDSALILATTNAIKEVIKALGVKIETEFETRELSQKGNYDVKIKGRTMERARGYISGVKRVAYHDERVKNGFRVWAMVRVNPEDFEKAKREIEESNKRLREYAQKLIEEAKEKEKRKDFYGAFLNYKAVLDVCKEIDAKELEKIAQIDIENLLEVAGKDILLEIKPEDFRLKEVYLVDLNGDKIPNQIKIGKDIKIKVKIAKPSYIYILSYDKEEERFYWILPCIYEKENFFTGDVILPQKIKIKAVPPAGRNEILIFATDKPVNCGDIKEFLNNLKKVKFDIKKITCWLVED